VPSIPQQSAPPPPPPPPLVAGYLFVGHRRRSFLENSIRCL
jgi:hypothetical protein